MLLTVTCNPTAYGEHIAAFALQQWVCEHATVLRYMYIANLLHVLLLLLLMWLIFVGGGVYFLDKLYSNDVSWISCN
jgi:hypothetical protein